MRFIVLLSLIFTLTACNLANQPPETIEVMVVVTATDAPASATPSPTPTSSPTSPPPASSDNSASVPANDTSTDDCAAPSGWVSYTVQRGDTLFSIARNAESNVDDLVRENCLASASALSVGQVIAIPQAIDSGAPQAEGNIIYWVGSETRQTNNGVEVGCATFVEPVTTNTQLTGVPERDIENGLNALFTGVPNASSSNWWQTLGLSVAEVDIDTSTQFATITVNGDMLLLGACADPMIREQIILTVLANAPEIQFIQIWIGGTNLTQLMDMSGYSGTDAAFSAASHPLPPNLR